MKKVAVLLSVGVFLMISCAKKDQESQVSDVSFTPCQQTKAATDDVSGKVDVAFTNEGVKITHYNFEVTCDFTVVNVTHSFVNGVLRITQQGTPNQAKCICHTDVSYTINGLSQKDVNVIFINGVQVYCHNDTNPQPNIKDGVYSGIFTVTYASEKRSGTTTVVLKNGRFTCSGNPDRIPAGGSGSFTTKNDTIIFNDENFWTADFDWNLILSGRYNFIYDGKKLKFSSYKNDVGFYEYDLELVDTGGCDQNVIISAAEFKNAPNFPVFIGDMKIEGNCLKIKFTSSGCDGKSWVVKLIDEGTISTTSIGLPPQRTLRLSLDNQEACAAVFGKEISFNIEDLQIPGSNKVLLDISGKSILYEY